MGFNPIESDSDRIQIKKVYKLGHILAFVSSTFTMPDQCRYCSKLFATASNRVRHEKQYHMDGTDVTESGRMMIMMITMMRRKDQTARREVVSQKNLPR